MSTIIDSESIRRSEQERLDRLRTPSERNKLGQFATPPSLALDIAKFVWNRLKKRKGQITFLDPAVGTGSFFAALVQAFPADRIESATGVEIDQAFADAAASIWTEQGLQVIHDDFTDRKPDVPYNVVLTNPPYVRHHHLGGMKKRRLVQLAYEATGLRLSGLSGLYCYFLLIAHSWLADRGIAAWLIPSEFMDVNYGEQVKRYLTEQVSLLRIHRYCPSDVQFDDALVSSAIVVFEKSPPKPDHEAVVSFGGTLAKPAKSQTLPLTELRETRKWTSLPRQSHNGFQRAGVTLGDLFTVKRGIATGGNSFFIVPKSDLDRLGIPVEFVRPILPSPRFLKQATIEADASGWPVLDRQLALIDCLYAEEVVREKWPRFWSYLESGKEEGIARGYITSRRSPWYSQEKRDAPPLLCTYMGRCAERPFRFIWNKSAAIAANVYLLLYPKQHVAAAVAERASDVLTALAAICPRQLSSAGRVYGGGLYKVEPAELMRVPADDLARLLGITIQLQHSLF